MCYLAWFSVPQIETKNFFLDLSCMTFDRAIDDKELPFFLLHKKCLDYRVFIRRFSGGNLLLFMGLGVGQIPPKK